MSFILLIILCVIIVIGLYVLHNSENKTLILIYKILGILCVILIAAFLITLL